MEGAAGFAPNKFDDGCEETAAPKPVVAAAGAPKAPNVVPERGYIVSIAP